MKKFNKILFFILLINIIFSCKTDRNEDGNQSTEIKPQITFVTSLLPKDIIYFTIETTNQVSIDWGDGKKEDYPSNTGYPASSLMMGEVKGNEIKIFCANGGSITNFKIIEMKINSLNIANATNLKNLDVSQNELSSVDISKNLALKKINLVVNRIKQQSMNQIMNDLPTRTSGEGAIIKVADKVSYNSLEQNEAPLTSYQIIAENKNWTVEVK